MNRELYEISRRGKYIPAFVPRGMSATQQGFTPTHFSFRTEANIAKKVYESDPRISFLSIRNLSGGDIYASWGFPCDAESGMRFANGVVQAFQPNAPTESLFIFSTVAGGRVEVFIGR